MSFRPTTIERAYQLAESGACRTVGDVKQALKNEGYDRIQDSLYGGAVTAALRKRCQDNFVALDETDEVRPADKSVDEDVA
ncbi:MAG: hypothetical protein EON91_09915 [Brevundimonas sp.]|uniref:hypothetical protein n=1 Tax=Brevundimonas sp. TaxID=1871086 RepID=UPI0011F8FAA7|nr:hypothetical protein [Brevundimonas sp.]RZJ17301.1 MAG: hypothetical protein EON91_09915 [Brevundimonas sp.]